MENKSNEEWAELVRAQVAVIDGLTLELATRQPATPAAPLVTVDTPEFQAAVGNWRSSLDYFQSDEDPYVIENWNSIIAHIDAHTARAVAAADRDRDHWKAIAQAFCDAAKPSQPVAGELPPLSDEQLDRIARNYFVEPYGQEQVKNAIHDAFLECRAAQPVQQPAAVVGQEYYMVIDKENSWDSVSKDLYDVTPEWNRRILYIAPVPAPVTAAVVGQEPVAWRYQGSSAADPTPRWVYCDDAGNLGLRQPLYTAPAPAAGVQGDDVLPEDFRPNKWEGSTAKDKAAITWLRNEAQHWHDKTAQPDSGRDAALVDELVEAARECTGSALLADAIRLRARFKSILAAHPAPSSDAAQLIGWNWKARQEQAAIGDAFHTGYLPQGFVPLSPEVEEIVVKFAQALREAKFEASSEAHMKKVAREDVEYWKAKAAHPANGAQADVHSALKECEALRSQLGDDFAPNLIKGAPAGDAELLGALADVLDDAKLGQGSYHVNYDGNKLGAAIEAILAAAKKGGA